MSTPTRRGLSTCCAVADIGQPTVVQAIKPINSRRFIALPTPFGPRHRRRSKEHPERAELPQCPLYPDNGRESRFPHKAMSALAPKADIAATSTFAMVPFSSARFVHKPGKYVRATVQQRTRSATLHQSRRRADAVHRNHEDHLGGGARRRSSCWHCYAARLLSRDQNAVTYLDGSVNWTPSRYRIELTAEQLASMGATVQPNQSSEEIDVTEFVRLGLLKPA
jgi:hypothetical protein